MVEVITAGPVSRSLSVSARFIANSLDGVGSVQQLRAAGSSPTTATCFDLQLGIVKGEGGVLNGN